MHIFKFRLVHVLAVFRLVVHKCPEEHPDESESADDDESPFPTELECERGYAQRSCESTYRCTGIEYGSCECTVFLGKVFGSDLDGCGEVACFA